MRAPPTSVTVSDTARIRESNFVELQKLGGVVFRGDPQSDVRFGVERAKTMVCEPKCGALGSGEGLCFGGFHISRTAGRIGFRF